MEADDPILGFAMDDYKPAKTKWSYCRKTAKRQYPTMAQARGAAQDVQGLSGTPMRFYLCPSCKYWHLTSTAQRKGQYPKRDDRRQLKRR